MRTLHLTHGPTLAVGLGTFAVLALSPRVLPRVPAPLVAMVMAGAAVRALGLDRAGVATVGAALHPPDRAAGRGAARHRRGPARIPRPRVVGMAGREREWADRIAAGDACEALAGIRLFPTLRQAATAFREATDVT